MKNEKNLIIFDFDGVIADSFAVYYKEVAGLLKERGHKFINNEGDFLALFDENVIVALRNKGVSWTEMLALWRQFEKGVEERGVKIYEGVPEMLSALKKDNILAVISSNSTTLVEGVLSRHQLARNFNYICGGERRESKTERIFWLKRHFEGDNDHVWYVGDTVGDIVEAKEANVKNIAVTWGWHAKERLISTAPDFVVDTPADIVDLFKSPSCNQGGGS